MLGDYLYYTFAFIIDSYYRPVYTPAKDVYSDYNLDNFDVCI